MIPLMAGGAVWLVLVVATYFKLGGSPPKKKQGAGTSPEPKQRLERCYSDHLHSAYSHAVNESESAEWNPFTNETKYLPALQRVKIAIMTWTVFPIRAVISLVLLILFVSYGNLAAIGLPAGAGLTKPISSFRRALLFPARLLLRSLLFAWGFHWIKVKGKRASAKEAPVIVPNHVCFIEPLYLVYANLPMSVGARATMMFPGTSAIHQLLQSIPLEKYKEPNV